MPLNLKQTLTIEVKHVTCVLQNLISYQIILPILNYKWQLKCSAKIPIDIIIYLCFRYIVSLDDS